MTEKLKSPDVEDGLALYVNAFLWLDTEREGLNAIPWSSIVAYCHEYELTPTQCDNMLDYIRLIDNAVLEQRANEAERQRNAS